FVQVAGAARFLPPAAPGVHGWLRGPHRAAAAPPTAPGALPAPAPPTEAPLPPAPPPPLPPRPTPLPDVSRACSSRNVSRESKSCTRVRAASTRCLSVLFSCSKSATRPRVSGSSFDVGPRAPLSFSSASALTARARHKASSSATWRRIVSSWSRTGASDLSPSYPKLILQRRKTPLLERDHVRLA